MKRYYVTMTWDDFPEGGSYGDIFEADSPEQAEQLCVQAMAEARSKGSDDPDEAPEVYISDYASDWHLIDCFDLDEFIAKHQKPSPDNPLAVRSWRVSVKAIVPREQLEPDDALLLPEYFVAARTEHEALDIFHSTVAIGMLEDFDISTELVGQATMPSPAPGSAETAGRRTYLHMETRCPSKHHNDGSDVCSDCGYDLQSTEGERDVFNEREPEAGTDDEAETMYLNVYECDHEGTAYEGTPGAYWEDKWSCGCDDDCPVCGTDVSPTTSEEIE
jgi:hypothetical protein